MPAQQGREFFFDSGHDPRPGIHAPQAAKNSGGQRHVAQRGKTQD
jgi:hypothetical protein